MIDAVFVTGANGLLGAAITHRLCLKLPHKVAIVAFVRSEASASELRAAIGRHAGRVAIRIADLLARATFLQAARSERFGEAVLIHCAADVSWQKSFEELRAVNVNGALAAASYLAGTADKGHFVYISSAYTSRGEWAYRNGYEETKAFAEQCLRDRFPQLSISSFSCSLIVGRQSDGEISRFHGLYPLVRLMAFFEPPFLVGRPDCRIDLVPIDWVCDELYGATMRAVDTGPQDVVATAGEGAVRLEDMVAEIETTLNRFRKRHGLTERREVPIISNRRWLFLSRSIESWQPEIEDRREVRQIANLFDVFKPYTQSDAIRPSQGLASTAPSSRALIGPSVRFWLDRNEKKLLSRLRAGQGDADQGSQVASTD